MSNATSDRSVIVDLEAVAWLYSETEQILTQTQKALKDRLRVMSGERQPSKGSEQAIFADLLNKLQQNIKAFNMVGVFGVPQMLKGINDAVEHLMLHPDVFNEKNVYSIDCACFALLDYLQHILRRRGENPVALFSQYADVVAISGHNALPADLWEFKWTWTDVNLPPKPYTDEEQKEALSRIDSFMLSLLRGKFGAAIDFRNIALEQVYTTENVKARQFWSLVAGFFDGLAAGVISLDAYTKRTASQILQIHKAYRQNKLEIADEFVENLLFFCANCRTDLLDKIPSVQAAVIDAYKLGGMGWVDYNNKIYGRIDPKLSAQLQKEIGHMKGSWSAFSSGTPVQLHTVLATVTIVTELLKRVLPVSGKFAETLLQTVSELLKKGKAPTPEVSLEIATCTLFLEAVFNNLDFDDEALEPRFALLTKRLVKLMETGSPEPLDRWIEELYQNINDHESMENVVGELHAMLHGIEQHVDAYLRKNAGIHVLTSAITDMQQMQGVVSVLGLDAAASALSVMQKQLQWLFNHHAEVHEEITIERGKIISSLSNSLGVLGFLVNMLGYQPLIARELFVFDKDKQELVLLMGRKEDGDASEAHFVADDVALGNTWGLAKETSAVEVPVQSAQEPASSASYDDDFEAEDLRGIFLEEAPEIIEMGREDLKNLRENPSDRDTLKSLRGRFHTLKGSSRMVGLMEYGEAAWAAEQCFNKWMTADTPASQSLLDFSSWAFDELLAWANDLQTGQHVERGAAEFEKQAERALSLAADAKEEHDTIIISTDDDAKDSDETIITDPDYGDDDTNFENYPAIEVDLSKIDLSLMSEGEDQADEASAEEESDIEDLMRLDSISFADTADDALDVDITVKDASEMIPEDDDIEIDVIDSPSDKNVYEVAPAFMEEPLAMKPETSEVDAAEADVVVGGGLKINKALYDIYIEEAFEKIREMEAALLKWQTAGNIGALKNASELAHAIAGSSATVSYTDLSRFSKLLERCIEHYLECLDKNQIPFDRSFTLLFWEAAQEIHHRLVLMTQGSLLSPSAELFGRLDDFLAAELKRIDEDDKVSLSLSQEVPVVRIEDDLQVDSIRDDDFNQQKQKESALLSEMFAYFKEEFYELYAEASKELESWLITPSADEHLIKTLRALHTLKGSARLAGAVRVGSITHDFEALLENFRDNNIALTPEVTQDIQHHMDALLNEFELLNAAEVAVEDVHSLFDAHDSASDEFGADEVKEEEKPDLLGVAQAPASAKSQSKAPDALDMQPDPKYLAVYKLDPDDLGAIASDIFCVFQEEATDLFAIISKDLREWRETNASYSMDEILRTLHTLKGSSRLAGAMRIGSMVHDLETLLKNTQTLDISKVEGYFEEIELEFDLLTKAAEEVRSGLVTLPLKEAEDNAALTIQEHQQTQLLPENAFLALDAIDRAIVGSELYSSFSGEAKRQIDLIGEKLGQWQHNSDSKTFLADVLSSLGTLSDNTRLAGINRLSELIQELDESIRPLLGMSISPEQVVQVTKQFSDVRFEFNLLDAAAQEVRKEFVSRFSDEQEREADELEVDEAFSLHLNEPDSVQDTVRDTLSLPDESKESQDLEEDLELEDVLEVEDLPVVEDIAEEEELTKEEELFELDDAFEAEELPEAEEFTEDDVFELDNVLEAAESLEVEETLEIVEAEDLITEGVFESDDLLEAEELLEAEDIAEEEELTAEEIFEPADAFEVEELPEVEEVADEEELSAEEVFEPEDSLEVEDQPPVIEELAEVEELFEAKELPKVLEQEDAHVASQVLPRAIQPTIARTVKTETSGQMLRVRASLIDELVTKSSEVNMIRSQAAGEVKQLKDMLINELSLNLERLRSQLRDIEMQAETQMQSRMDAARAEGHEFDPLEFDRYTRIQELTRMMAESVNDVATVQKALMHTSTALEDGLAAQSRSARDMQHILLRARMVKFSSISERFQRIVRLSASECDKKVKLTVEGGEIEVDRGVLDHVGPAFEHMLRNSVVHGIESPEKRAELGKEPVGEIKIKLSQEGNDVSIVVSDDGAGLDLVKIRKKAEDIGLITPESNVSDHDLAQLIYKSGLTTAENVTELAGRGIGLDMAYAEIAGLGGRIAVYTETSKGTQFELLLPLTTAVTQVVLVNVGDKTFGIPVSLIESIQRFTMADTTNAIKHGVIHHNNEDLPAYWLGGLLEVDTPTTTIKKHPLQWLVLRGAGQRIIVAVDHVIGSQEVVIKNVGPQFAHLTGFSGLTILSGGRSVLIYNPISLARVFGDQQGKFSSIFAMDAVAEEANASPSTTLATPVQPSTPSRPRTKKVMVVDDSLTVRRITQRVLERAGFEVVLAKDGMDALKQLTQELPALILSDIEMPRMDGFEFVRQLRNDAETKNIPVIMITSRIAQKHHDYAQELGVNHYLGKPYDDEELLKLTKDYVAKAPVS